MTSTHTPTMTSTHTPTMTSTHTYEIPLLPTWTTPANSEMHEYFHARPVDAWSFRGLVQYVHFCQEFHDREPCEDLKLVWKLNLKKIIAQRETPQYVSRKCQALFLEPIDELTYDLEALAVTGDKGNDKDVEVDPNEPDQKTRIPWGVEGVPMFNAWRLRQRHHDITDESKEELRSRVAKYALKDDDEDLGVVERIANNFWHAKDKKTLFALLTEMSPLMRSAGPIEDMEFELQYMWSVLDQMRFHWGTHYIDRKHLEGWMLAFIKSHVFNLLHTLENTQLHMTEKKPNLNSLEDVKARKKQVPSGGEQVPPAAEQAPPAGEQEPLNEEQVPSDGEQVPPAAEQAPPAGEQAPPAAEQAPLAGEQVSPAQEQLPSDEGQGVSSTDNAPKAADPSNVRHDGILIQYNFKENLVVIEAKCHEKQADQDKDVLKLEDALTANLIKMSKRFEEEEDIYSLKTFGILCSGFRISLFEARFRQGPEASKRHP
ncbi:MAG: hypothetical protein J3Q66DRAFT_385938 [Benniella sp.]|nr:MAG: hypothetical protein J3Q66DRAFT_423243 [Benniella sp.]KAK3820984.1 MAG: hypothetical protein J3Q66DRAFT_385938 [Benniella sp.]